MTRTRTSTDPSPLRIAAVLVAIVAWASLGGLASAQSAGAQAAQPGIHVSGTGVVHGEPDMATVDLGFSASAADVREALAEADEVMTAVRDAVVQAGVDGLDVRTNAFQVWRDQPVDRDGQPGEVRFQVRHVYQVVVREIEALGDVLAAAVAAGANDVGGIRFAVSDPSVLASEARALAMADAQAKATELAELSGVGLGVPLSISEAGAGGMPMMQARADVQAFSGASVEAGQLAVTVQLQVTFGIE